MTDLDQAHLAELSSSLKEMERQNQEDRAEFRQFRVQILGEVGEIRKGLNANTEKMTVISAVWLVLKVLFAAAVSIAATTIAYKGLK